MIYVLGSVITSCILVILFRIYQKHLIDLIQAITVNYWVCVICGWLYNPQIFSNLLSTNKEVYIVAIIQGFLFIFMFFQIGKASQEIGLGYTGLFGRLSVVIPVSVSLFFFNEKITSSQAIGIIIGLIAIYLLSISSSGKSNVKSLKLFRMGLILFLGNGVIDTIFKFFTENYSKTVSQEVFTIMVFGTAGILGSIYVLLFEKSLKIKNVVAGIGLGIPNFFSLIFMLSGLKVVEASKFFPLNNIGIILFLIFVGVLAFQEKIYPKMWLGLFLTILAILFISELITM